MNGRPFDLDRMERIKQPRFKLYDCRRERWVETPRGRKLARYPETAANIERMLAAEGASLS